METLNAEPYKSLFSMSSPLKGSEAVDRNEVMGQLDAWLLRLDSMLPLGGSMNVITSPEKG